MAGRGRHGPAARGPAVQIAVVEVVGESARGVVRRRGGDRSGHAGAVIVSVCAVGGRRRIGFRAARGAGLNRQRRPRENRGQRLGAAYGPDQRILRGLAAGPRPFYESVAARRRGGEGDRRAVVVPVAAGTDAAARRRTALDRDVVLLLPLPGERGVLTNGESDGIAAAGRRHAAGAGPARAGPAFLSRLHHVLVHGRRDGGVVVVPVRAVAGIRTVDGTLFAYDDQPHLLHGVDRLHGLRSVHHDGQRGRRTDVGAVHLPVVEIEAGVGRLTVGDTGTGTVESGARRDDAAGRRLRGDGHLVPGVPLPRYAREGLVERHRHLRGGAAGRNRAGAGPARAVILVAAGGERRIGLQRDGGAPVVGVRSHVRRTGTGAGSGLDHERRFGEVRHQALRSVHRHAQRVLRAGVVARPACENVSRVRRRRQCDGGTVVVPAAGRRDVHGAAVGRVHAGLQQILRLPEPRHGRVHCYGEGGARSAAGRRHTAGAGPARADVTNPVIAGVVERRRPAGGGHVCAEVVRVRPHSRIRLTVIGVDRQRHLVDGEVGGHVLGSIHENGGCLFGAAGVSRPRDEVIARSGVGRGGQRDRSAGGMPAVARRDRAAGRGLTGRVEKVLEIPEPGDGGVLMDDEGDGSAAAGGRHAAGAGPAGAAIARVGRDRHILRRAAGHGRAVVVGMSADGRTYSRVIDGAVDRQNPLGEGRRHVFGTVHDDLDRILRAGGVAHPSCEREPRVGGGSDGDGVTLVVPGVAGRIDRAAVGRVAGGAQPVADAPVPRYGRVLGDREGHGVAAAGGRHGTGAGPARTDVLYPLAAADRRRNRAGDAGAVVVGVLTDGRGRRAVLGGDRQHRHHRDEVRFRLRVRASGAAHGERDRVIAPLGVFVSRVLLGRGGAVAEVPLPGVDHAGGKIGEIDGEGISACGRRRFEFRVRGERADPDIARLEREVLALRSGDRQLHVESAFAGVGVRGILFVGGAAVAELPGPRIDYAGGAVAELDGERHGARSRGAFEIRLRRKIGRRRRIARYRLRIAEDAAHQRVALEGERHATQISRALIRILHAHSQRTGDHLIALAVAHDELSAVHGVEGVGRVVLQLLHHRLRGQHHEGTPFRLVGASHGRQQRGRESEHQDGEDHQRHHHLDEREPFLPHLYSLLTLSAHRESAWLPLSSPCVSPRASSLVRVSTSFPWEVSTR